MLRGMISRYQLLAADLDGTLLDDDGQLPAAVVDVLQRAQAAGIHVVAATGRRLSSAMPHLLRAGLTGGCVVQNGAVVATVPGGEVLRSYRLPEPLVRRLLAFLRSEDLAAVVYRDVATGPGEVQWERLAPDPTGFLRWYRKHAAGHHREVERLDEAELDAVIRLTTYQTPERLQQVEALLQAGFSQQLRSFRTHDPARRIHRLEIMPCEADKWRGVKFWAERFGVEPGAVLAVGDDRNDVEMLAQAGHSLAAPGATESAREAARVQISGEGPAAVARALEQELFAESSA